MNSTSSCISGAAVRPECSPGPCNKEAKQDRELVDQIRSSDLFRSFEDAFQTMMGLPLALRQVGVFDRPFEASRNVSPFCKLMTAGGRSCAACLTLHQQVEELCAEGPRQCYAGLYEAAVPVRAGERIVAYLQTGQVMYRRPTMAQFMRTITQLKGWGVDVTDRRRFEEAYFSVRVMDRDQFEASARVLSIFADQLSSLLNQLLLKQAASELPAVAKARAYIAAHQSDEISLSDVAAAVNMSIFYFCKTFKRVTGVTFVDYLARLRVESVKQLLLNPHKRISEAAFEVGFQSLSQFNRAFRRIVGQAPTDYRIRIHGSAFPSAANAAAAA